MKVNKTVSKTTSPTIGILRFSGYSPSPSSVLEAMRRDTERFSHTTKNYIGQHYTTMEKNILFSCWGKEAAWELGKGWITSSLLLDAHDRHDAVGGVYVSQSVTDVTDHLRPKPLHVAQV